MAISLREIIATFTVGVDDAQLKKLDKNIDSVVSKIVTAGKVLANGFAAKAIGSFFAGQVENAAHIQDLSERLDVGAQSIREFSYAASTAGVGIDAAARALGFLEKAQGGALNGSKAQVKAFAEVGVSVKDVSGKAKPLEQLLDDVADAFAKMPNQAERAAAATKLFGRAGRDLLPILDGGSEKIHALMADAKLLGNGLGSKYYQDAKKAREESLRLGYAWQSMKDRITAAALPAIVSFLKFLEKLSVGFLDLMKHTFMVESALSFLAIGGVYKLGVALYGLAAAFGLVGASALETLGALAGFAAPVAIATALYIAFDDLYTLFSGGNSEIGELIDSLGGIGTAGTAVLYMNAGLKDTIDIVKDLGSAVKHTFGGLWAGVKSVAKAAAEFGDENATGDQAREQLKKAWADLQAGGNEMSDEGQAILDALGNPKTGNHLTKLHEQLKKAFIPTGNKFVGPPPVGYEPGKLGNIRGFVSTNPEDRALVPEATVSPTAPQTVRVPSSHAAGPTNVIHQKNDVKVDVHAAPTQHPNQVGNAVGKGVAEHTSAGARDALESVTEP